MFRKDNYIKQAKNTKNRTVNKQLKPHHHSVPVTWQGVTGTCFNETKCEGSGKLKGRGCLITGRMLSNKDIYIVNEREEEER